MKRCITISLFLMLLMTRAFAQSEDRYPVDFTLNEPISARPGETLSLKVTFKVDSGWHIYAPTGINEVQGMYETKIVFRLPTGFSRNGKLKLPVSKFAGGFEVYDGAKIVMEQELTVAPDTKPGDYAIDATIIYQACTDNSCLPPVTKDTVFKVAIEKTSSNGVPKKSVELNFKALDGRQIDLKKMKAKLILIDTWATWCKPCVDEFENVKKMYAKYQGNGLEVIGISADDQASLPRVNQLISQYRLPWPQYFEGKGFAKNSFIKAQGIKSLPAVFLLDKDGNILDKDARAERLEALILRHLSN